MDARQRSVFYATATHFLFDDKRTAAEVRGSSPTANRRAHLALRILKTSELSSMMSCVHCMVCVCVLHSHHITTFAGCLTAQSFKKDDLFHWTNISLSSDNLLKDAYVYRALFEADDEGCSLDFV